MAKRQQQNATKDAKQRLLEAAIKIFSQQGFEAASTRMLVKEAGVNISAIPYYFDSKEGLYEAVIRHIIAIIQDARGEQAMQIRQALDSGNLTQEEAQELLHEFIRGFASFLLSDKVSSSLGQIMIREQMQPTSVFDILYEGAMRPMHETLTRLVAYLTDKPATDSKLVACTHTLMGQILIFKTHREVLLRRLKRSSYDAAQVEEIISLILQNTDAIIQVHRGT